MGENDIQALEAQLLELQQKEVQIKQGIGDPKNFLHDLYSTSSPKKDLIQQWAENLETQHEIELKLDKTLTVQSIGHISSYIKDELRKLGVHKSTMPYVHEVLAFKYKNDKYDSSEKDDDEGDADPRLNSSNVIAAENHPLVDVIEKQILLLKLYRLKLKSSPFLSQLDVKQRLLVEEEILKINATQFFAEQIIDDRQSVPILSQLKLINAVVAQTNNFASGLYVSQIKIFGANKMLEAQNFFKKTARAALEFLPVDSRQLFTNTIINIQKLRHELEKEKISEKIQTKKPEDTMTPKQAKKIVYGLVKYMLPLLDHKNRDEAICDGFYGVKCPECGSTRVEEKEHPDAHQFMCFCYGCESWFEAKTVSKCLKCHLPFFEEILNVMIKEAKPIEIENSSKQKQYVEGALSTTCPRCQYDVILPKKMFEKPILRGKR